jgi:hypothetical protein
MEVIERTSTRTGLRSEAELLVLENGLTKFIKMA